MTTNSDKKVYSLEDNVKCICFCLKDIVMEIQKLNKTLALMTEEIKKLDDEIGIPL